jgi:hypothetical protein
VRTACTFRTAIESGRVSAAAWLLTFTLALIAPLHLHAENPASAIAKASTCPRGTGWVIAGDGCEHAQSNGSFLIPNFFHGYTGTRYAHRPPWNVAGVDYALGYVGPLEDPTVSGSLPECASLSDSRHESYLVTVSHACEIDELDFSLHGGICVIVTADSGTVTFSNDKFGWGLHCNNNGGELLSLQGTAPVRVQYSEFIDAHAKDNRLQSIIATRGKSTARVTIVYSDFRDPDQAAIELIRPTELNVSYNYVENIGAPPAHGDWVIPFASGIVAYHDSWNTIYAGNQTITTTCYVVNGTSQATGSVTGYCQHNTVIGGTNGPSGFLVVVNSGFNTIVGPFDVSNNWFAQALAYGYYAQEGSGGTIVGPITCRGNRDLLTGLIVYGKLGPAICN